MLRKRVNLIFDTETVDTVEPLIYDIGWYVVDKRGNVLGKSRSLIQEVITNPDAMRKAFYHRKVFTEYLPMLDNSPHRIIRPWDSMMRLLRADMDMFKVNIVSAYNLPFDVRAMRYTARYCEGSKTMVRPVDRLCLWNWACKDIFNRPTYRAMAIANGWTTPSGNLRTTAEHAYRYITNQPDYIEPHTALEDSEIEAAIYHRLVRSKRAIPYNVTHGSPWRFVKGV